ncbi:MAG: NAD(+)/NADH kinase [Planctomycetota bacterium]
MPRSALLVVNRQRPEAAASAREVVELIRRHGTLLAETESHDPKIPELAASADLVVVLGGDGSLLGQARRIAGLGVPVLGVNFGRLGFIAEFELHALTEQAAAIFGDGPLQTRELRFLSVSIARADGSVGFEAIALNEAVITAGPPYRVIQLAISIDSLPGPSFGGDGLIVSTPTGSTAYNLSAGGPIVAPGVDAFTITPIAPHSLSFRPILVPGTSQIELTLSRANADPGSEGTTLILDGQVMQPLRTGDRVLIRRAEETLRFVVNPRADFWSALTTKLRWAEPPRMRQ